MVAAREFAAEIASRVREFEGFVASGSDPGSDALSRLGNRRSGMVHMFLEAQVRSLVEERLRPKRLVSGILSVPGASGPTGVPVLIKGAIYDPGRGRPMLERGGVCVVNPAT
jgi:hypothetical protein